MTSKQGEMVLRIIHGIAPKHRAGQASDRELLHRFATQHDQDAFAALIRRYGSMVMGLGMRVLGRREDAEDVCQATFLILAQKANAIVWRDSVANWLYEVAYRLARKTQEVGQRRKLHEARVAPKPPADPLEDITIRDLQVILDEELSRLPTKQRTPLILCCLEGKSRDEAAQCLGVPLSTIISRLAEGREALRRRLARRGVTFSLAFASLTLFSEAVRAGVPARLVQATGQVAGMAARQQNIAGLVSAKVTALVNGGIQTMFLWKLKAAAVVLAACLLAAGATAVLSQSGNPVSAQNAKLERDLKPRLASAPPSGVDAAQDKVKEAQKNPTLEKALQVARDMPINDRGDKVLYLAQVASAQVRAGDKEAARKTIQLALDSLKDVGKTNEVHKIPALGAIFRHQILAGDLPGARKTQEIVQELLDNTMDANVKLNGKGTINNIHGEFARIQARSGETKEALKTVEAIDNIHMRIGFTWAIAVEQAKRKDFKGALKTLAPLNSVRQAEMIAAVATLQEKTDKAGAEKTWKLVLEALRKLELSKEEELYPWPGGLKLHTVIRALAERGHGAAVQQWIEGLPEPQIQVNLLLILAGKD